MNIAWTSLFHAIFEKQKVKYCYREKNSIRYKKVDNEYKAWELSKCIKEYYSDNQNPIRSNIEFMIGLRNKIEHRFMPELDICIFGECQANLLNFENLLVKEFGNDLAINENLVFALQFSQKKQEQQINALRSLQSKEFKFVKSYIDNFRDSLPSIIQQSLDYSFKVYLIPKVGNHIGSSDVAIEFVKYDPTKPEEMKKYEKITTLVKEKQVPVINYGKLRPSDVADRVSDSLDITFSASHHHAKCWKYYKVRPLKEDLHPERTNPKYCHYDSIHGDYLYTEEWVSFLIKELSNKVKYEKVMM